MEQKNKTKRVAGQVWVFFLLLLIILGVYLLIRSSVGIREDVDKEGEWIDNALEVPE